MKTNGRAGGGAVQQPAKLKPGSEIDYANHLRGYLEYLNEHNAPIYAVSILNEPDWGGQATYEGMDWTIPEIISWWELVGHFTTQKVASGSTKNDVRYAKDVIPGFGGGRATPHVLTMHAETFGAPGYVDPAMRNTRANNNVDIWARHLYNDQARYTTLLGQVDTPYASMPDQNFNGTTEVDGTEREGGWVGQREMWMTEHLPESNSAAQLTWPYVFDMLNQMDHTVRVNGESGYCLWFSQDYAGLVTTVDYLGATIGGITNRGKAFAHYTRFANETFRLGVTRTKGTIAYNPTVYNLADNTMKISAYEDPDGKFISVVMFTPLTPATAAGGVAPGEMKITLPAGFTAKSAYALKSDATSQWADEPVVLSADGNSAIVNLPAGTILSVKFVK
jgi:O-glycosyl hydrolase